MKDNPLNQALKQNTELTPSINTLAREENHPIIAPSENKIIRYSTVDKAGFSNVNFEKIDSILGTTSQNAFAAYNAAKEEKLDETIADLQRRKMQVERENEMRDFLTMARQNDISKTLQRIETKLENSRNLSDVWFYIDMDAFYCSCEAADDISLLGKPFVVANPTIVSTSSYEARRFGIRSSMPLFQAMKLCPSLIVVPVNMQKYEKVSDVIRSIFTTYDPNFIAKSLDEASLYLTPFLSRFSAGLDTADSKFELLSSIAREMQNQIYHATHCTCSIGVASNPSLAKIASNINKPNGIFQIEANKDRILEFTQRLPIRQIAGIGPVDEAILHNVFNISTVADLYLHRRTLLQVLNNERKITQYLNAALGFPDSPHPLASTAAAEKKEKSQKSFSRETTVSRPIVNLQEALSVGRTLTEKLVNEIVKRYENRPGGSIRTITLKIDETSFVSRSKTANLNGPIPLHFESIWEVVQQLIQEEFHKESKVRLIGVKLSKLSFSSTNEFSHLNTIDKFFSPSTSQTASSRQKNSKTSRFPKKVI
jgi:DNA polymerase kappa